MICISSHRMHSKCEEVRQNQLRAKESWNGVFDRIYYLGREEPELAGPNTEFIDGEDFPTIWSMALFLAAELQRHSGYGVLINADIVLGNELPSIADELKLRGAKSAISKRYQFNPPADPYATGKIVDWGLDFFLAESNVWELVSDLIPEKFRIGHCQFDTWLLSYMSGLCGRACYDLTKQRFVFHPKHGNRLTPYSFSTSPDEVIRSLRWPAGRLH